MGSHSSNFDMLIYDLGIIDCYRTIFINSNNERALKDLAAHKQALRNLEKDREWSLRDRVEGARAQKPQILRFEEKLRRLPKLNRRAKDIPVDNVPPKIQAPPHRKTEVGDPCGK